MMSRRAQSGIRPDPADELTYPAALAPLRISPFSLTPGFALARRSGLKEPQVDTNRLRARASVI